MTHVSRSDPTRRPIRRAARALYLAGTVAIGVALLAPAAQAQRRARHARAPESLRGSPASVEKMYDFALRNRYPFYLTPTNVDAAISRGWLVALTGDSTYELTRGVGFSYATREAKQFVTQFAPQYLHACGAPLTVTSAARPLSRQPRNANRHSVHPTGIAVDIRRPPPGPCLTWVRSALATLESRGLIEATEEHHPIHLHLAVLAGPGSTLTLPNLVQGIAAAPRVPLEASVPPTVVAVANGEVGLPPAARMYVVRPGDTMFDIAGKAGVSVRALAAANGRTARSTLQPGTTLKLPGESGR